MRQEHTIKVERQSVQDGYQTGHGVDIYGAECWAVRKKAEMRVLRQARGNALLDHVRNVDIWKEAHIYPMAEFLGEKREVDMVWTCAKAR